MKIGDLVRILGRGLNPTRREAESYGIIGIVTEKAGKYLVVTDCDGQRYSLSQDYVEVLNVLV